MAVQIKCFVCNGVTLDDRECRVCEGKGQIESVLKLSVEDLKNWAERLQQQQQELVIIIPNKDEVWRTTQRDGAICATQTGQRVASTGSDGKQQ